MFQFRAIAIAEKSTARLEQAFLSQDCWFLNYEAKGDFDDDDEDDDEGFDEDLDEELDEDEDF